MNGSESDFDLNGDREVNFDDLSVCMRDFKNTWIGDANLDGEFSSGDLVQVFHAGTFETGEPANWEHGDWDGDGTFSSSDFVTALQDGGYEQGPRAGVAAVPEPTSVMLLAVAMAAVSILNGQRRHAGD